MEYYSDMGDGQTALDRKIIHKAQSYCLPRCDLVTAATEGIAEALEAEYGLADVLPILNVPPKFGQLPQEKEQGFSLYWRCAVLGISQRGLGDVLAAMQGLPADVTLFLRGKMPTDGGVRLKEQIRHRGLENRVVIQPAHLPHEAVTAAARHTVGLCPEQGGPRNQSLTVSSKLFDFLMAGLPVVVSDLPGIRTVAEIARAGLVYRNRDPGDLREKLLMLYRDRSLLEELAANAREYALTVGNLKVEMGKFCDAASRLTNSRVVTTP
jgi:glycosyltransferase involved in cell wall biosynthesis